MEKTYKVHEIFYSIQGEGVNAGLPVVFVRFLGCNLKCDFCDTQIKGARDLTAEQIYNEVDGLGGESGCNANRVIFTGGEPTLQLDGELAMLFANNGWWIGVETNGTTRFLESKLCNWVTVSPKVGGQVDPYWTKAYIDELRYPIKVGDPIPDVDMFENVENYCLSPVFDGLKPVKENIDYTMAMCASNPHFRLSVQIHKLISVR